MATILFKKKPNSKNFLNRSLSFQNDQISIVSSKDTVVVEIEGPSGTKINLTMAGSKFVKSLIDVGAENYKVLNF
jgi:hypothetical protein